METPPFEFARLNYPLARHTLYHIGGPATVALLPRDENEAAEAFAWMRAQPGKKLVLGGGSNVLINDAGFDGIVLFTTELKRMEGLGGDRYYVGAGRELDDMVRNIMLVHNYDGVGGFTGIPGSVGGAIYMNAGTVKGSTCQWMASVDVMKPSGLETIPMRPELYSYRGQTFCDPGDVILGGVFQFTPAETDQSAIYAHYKQRRREKQPQGFCCGSVFKNPEGGHAGDLIERCGLKGTRRGGAIVSPMHANFIMNDDNATFQNVLDLIALAKERVRAQHGVELEEEVRIIW
ncbi:MAG: UDP-N-acetylmuramate dehydrogenase [Candidatus Hydrogenedentes bacterium]|nr:UDP-N-acetylmuramate dehydrogenase [Candidatus Hydrogenedentota bacterium]